MSLTYWTCGSSTRSGGAQGCAGKAQGALEQASFSAPPSSFAPCAPRASQTPARSPATTAAAAASPAAALAQRRSQRRAPRRRLRHPLARLNLTLQGRAGRRWPQRRRRCLRCQGGDEQKQHVGAPGPGPRRGRRCRAAASRQQVRRGPGRTPGPCPARRRHLRGRTAIRRRRCCSHRHCRRCCRR
jgi:hypothetical protein